MKKFNWVTTLILSLVTCGIYALYMFYVMADNSNKMAEKSGVQQIGQFILAVILGMITCGIYTLVWMYKFFKQQVEIAKANGVTVQPVEEPIILLVLCCVPVYSYYMLCDVYNKNVDASAPRFA